MPLCRTDRLNQLVWQSGFDSTKTVSAGNYDGKRGNYETVNVGNYEMGKDTSSWAALFTVPIHSFVLEVVMKTVMEIKESAAKIKG